MTRQRLCGIVPQQVQLAPIVAAPVLAGVHTQHPAASVPSAPPFDSHAFYASPGSSSSGGGSTNTRELWENDVIAAEKWEDPQVRQPIGLLYPRVDARLTCLAFCESSQARWAVACFSCFDLASHGLSVTFLMSRYLINRKRKRRRTFVQCAGAYLPPLCITVRTP